MFFILFCVIFFVKGFLVCQITTSNRFTAENCKSFKNEATGLPGSATTRYKNPQLVAQHFFIASFCRVSRFSLCVINLSYNKNICCGLKKVVAKSRARVYFGQQILALLLVFHQTHNLSRNKFARALASQLISAPHFFNP